MAVEQVSFTRMEDGTKEEYQLLARYDQNCFDPDYESLPLELFEPMVRRVLSTRRHDTP